MQCFRWNTVEVVGLGSVWMLSRGASHEGPRAPLKIYFARLGLRSTCGHPAAQRRPPDQLPPLVERLSIAKWGQGVQESTFPFKWDGKFFANFPPSWETLAPSQHFACSQQNQPGAQVIIRMEPARGAESGGKEAGARL